MKIVQLRWWRELNVDSLYPGTFNFNLGRTFSLCLRQWHAIANRFSVTTWPWARGSWQWRPYCGPIGSTMTRNQVGTFNFGRRDRIELRNWTKEMIVRDHSEFFFQRRVHMRGLWLTCNILPKENKFGMGEREMRDSVPFSWKFSIERELIQQKKKDRKDQYPVFFF